MKIIVREALKLKNRLKQEGGIQNMYSPQNSFEKGTQTSISDSNNPLLIEENFLKFSAYSRELNFKIHQFNVTNEIPLKVAKNKQNKVLKIFYNNLLNSTTPVVYIPSTKGGNVKTETEHFFTKAELKDKIKALNVETRQLTAEIDQLNSQEIELSFEFDDVE